jgi:hypothetical protein
VTLREALNGGRWFARISWERTFEPFAFRWTNGRLLRAPRGELFNTKVSERRFSPFDVLANDWETIDG